MWFELRLSVCVILKKLPNLPDSSVLTAETGMNVPTPCRGKAGSERNTHVKAYNTACGTEEENGSRSPFACEK